MEKIESFKVNHLILKSGIYVSRVDSKNGLDVTTFDLRVTAPNAEPPMDVPAIHTIEHLGATFLRNSKSKDDIIYFGPMGCRTGFYLVVFGRKTPEDVYSLVLDMCNFILTFNGDIPGATPKECGNYLDQNLPNAKYYAGKYKEELQYKRFIYPSFDKTLKAGCVLVNKETKKVALVFRGNLNDYTFPKGHVEGKETLEECAVRETAEEAKRVALLVRGIEPYVSSYTTPSGEQCVCFMYLAIDMGASSNLSTDTHPVVWVDVKDVNNQLTYDDLKQCYKSFYDKVMAIVE